jgi:hypothetical protein
MASNSGDSSASALRSSLNDGSLPTVPFLHSLPYGTDLVLQVVFLITFRHRIDNTVHSRMRIHCCRNLFTEPFPSSGRLFLLRICYLATDFISLSVLRLLPRNKICFRAVRSQRLFLCLHTSCFEQICHNIILIRVPRSRYWYLPF